MNEIGAMNRAEALDPPVRVTLFDAGRIEREFEARQVSDLRVRFEMLTGIGWLELLPYYLQLVEQGLDVLEAEDWVCHSYEKWGDWQQERLDIDVRMQRIGASVAVDGGPKPGEEIMQSERIDDRGEWYREFDPYAASMPRIPGIYWLGMLASAIWLAAYLLIYPAIPLPGGHWKGLGVPGGCQPWTAICELGQKQAALDELRGKYLARIGELSATEIAADFDLREFVDHAGRVRYIDQCGGCHDYPGRAVGKPSLVPLKPNRDIDARLAGIRSPQVHSFGLTQRIDETEAKLLAVYLWRIHSPDGTPP